MTKEEKEKLQESYKKIIENFPFDKYDSIIDTIRKVFEDLPENSDLLERIKKEVVNKSNV